MEKIFLVEDDESIRELVLYALKNAGYDAEGFEKAADFELALKGSGEKQAISLVLLDIMLPQKDGITILREMKTSAFCDIPIIMLTAKGSEYDKVKALDLGADDYVVKPFGVMELLSRVKAVLRRSKTAIPESSDAEIGKIFIKKNERAVIVKAEDETLQNCPLTFKEYELLVYLVQNKNIVLSREKIMDSVWGFDYEGESRTVDMHIKTLRQKLQEAGKQIKTIRNVGYMIQENE